MDARSEDPVSAAFIFDIREDKVGQGWGKFQIENQCADAEACIGMLKPFCFISLIN